MTHDKTAIEILTEFAKHSGRQIEIEEKAYPSAGPLHPVTYHRRRVCIPNNPKNTSYFICFGDSKEMGEKATFSGVFIPVEFATSFQIKIRKKDLMDKLNPFHKKDIIRSGIQQFDSQVAISGNDPIKARRFFNKRIIQNLVLRAFDIDEGFIVAVNELNIDFVPGLKGQSHVGIYSTQEWILDRIRIEKLFTLIEEFRVS
jgi:hypothetical protein